MKAEVRTTAVGVLSSSCFLFWKYQRRIWVRGSIIAPESPIRESLFTVYSLLVWCYSTWWEEEKQEYLTARDAVRKSAMTLSFLTPVFLITVPLCHCVLPHLRIHPLLGTSTHGPYAQTHLFIKHTVADLVHNLKHYGNLCTQALQCIIVMTACCAVRLASSMWWSSSTHIHTHTRFFIVPGPQRSQAKAKKCAICNDPSRNRPGSGYQWVAVLVISKRKEIAELRLSEN